MKGGRLNLGECNLVLQGQIGIALYCLQTVGNTLIRLQLGGRCRHIRMHCGEFGRFCHTSFSKNNSPHDTTHYYLSRQNQCFSFRPAKAAAMAPAGIFAGSLM